MTTPLDSVEPHSWAEVSDDELALEIAELLVENGEIVTLAPPRAVQGDEWIISVGRWE